MTAVGGPTAGSRSTQTLVARIVVWVVFAVLFAYMTAQSVGNFVVVTDKLQKFNEFVGSAGGASLKRPVPWVWLVLDVVVPPLAYAVGVWVTRRSTAVVTAAVLVVAFAAAGALWLTLQLYVPSLVDL
ncbi:hypothetical protein [Curtobacterium herbarum]|uniref:DUF1772 domain-containing protein n=1 Tax=Curtobacterium herbarum TaxID=150122 RepID=A0ABN1ZH41_9MICO|nr:hypothetical protein [Curtobacterium herbarum]MBM7475062.1 uncharacterized protein (DUF983 family) [Curtobacterium herbarum]MCS6545705.1 hypothetical protein [Curtobacterium herbarum]